MTRSQTSREQVRLVRRPPCPERERRPNNDQGEDRQDRKRVTRSLTTITGQVPAAPTSRRGCSVSVRGGTGEAPSFSSPPTVEMCHSARSKRLSAQRHPSGRPAISWDAWGSGTPPTRPSTVSLKLIRRVLLVLFNWSIVSIDPSRPDCRRRRATRKSGRASDGRPEGSQAHLRGHHEEV